jgi:hypothetical protein
MGKGSLGLTRELRFMQFGVKAQDMGKYQKKNIKYNLNIDELLF